MIIIVTFNILTYCYTKKNTLDGNVEVKKAVARNLKYITIVQVCVHVAAWKYSQLNLIQKL